jgi:hypothetical protein
MWILCLVIDTGDNPRITQVAQFNKNISNDPKDMSV